ncbi:histidine protein methyltransferase 1 homolog [Phlebotomus papatasi]|uniref:protein-histidine N-methyltransferase n=1 Tax=Phlebotomus papatasi TaxID=29031 RepID=A0A1B0D963_PHLPP|nr:histidine protein methyltransferase 1 homolog [Phlebotomus papatasi]
MFQFNFTVENTPDSGETVSEKEPKTEDKHAEPHVLASEEVVPDSSSLDDGSGQATAFISRDVEVFMLESVGSENDQAGSSDKEASHTDLIPGVYEGGFKIWECTQDLADYMIDNLGEELEGKDVLEVGCGAGVLGIIALKLGAAKCHFQDYNKDVLQKFTIPNVLLNAEVDEKVSIDKCQFYSGDWKSYSEVTGDRMFDIILTSETIYNPENNQKLIDLFMNKLRQGGKVLLAAKTYYFGVGGGLRQFEGLLGRKMNSMVVWKNCKGIKREIIKIEHI